MGVTVAITRFAANTSTGQQVISTNDLGGLTPKAVMLIATRGISDGTAVDGVGFYWGLSDGTNEATGGYESQHAQATMDAVANQDTTANRILTIYDGTADNVVEATADFVSFSADSVTVDWTDAPASAFLITAVFFAGTDLTANVGRIDLGNVADALIAVTTVGFEADIVFPFWNHTVDPGFVGMGVVHNNRAGTVSQQSLGHSQRGSFGTSSVGVMMRDGEGLHKILTSTQLLDYTLLFQTFDSSGFDIQLGNARSPGAADVAWLALRLGTSPVVSAKVYTYTTPTGTGAHTDAGAGFQPQFVMYLASRAAAVDTNESDADGGSFGVVLVDADDLYTQSISDEDNVADSNNQSLSDDKVNLPTHTGAAGHEATLTSMGSTGPVWSYSSTDGTARLWPALAIGINAAGDASPTASDSYTQSESAVVAADVPVSDSHTLTEAAETAVTLPGVESATLTEAVALSADIPGADTGTLSEASALDATTPLEGTDTAVLSESATVTVSLIGSDSFAFADSGDVVTLITGSDSFTLTDAGSLDTGVFVYVLSEAVRIPATLVTGATVPTQLSEAVTVPASI